MPSSNANIPGHEGNRPEDVIARQQAFLEEFDKRGTIKHACRAVGISRDTYRRWRKEYVNGFDELFSDIRDDFADEVELNLFQRAKDPDCNPVILIFALKGLKPDKYRDNAVVADESAKSIMEELKTKFRGIKFDDTPSKEEKTVHQQAEDILKRKSDG